MKLNFVRILSILFLMFLPFSGISQTNKLRGCIVDSNTQETLVGATIAVVGTMYKTFSDINGNFTFENLIPGNYKIQVSYISYENAILDFIIITNSPSERIKIVMNPLDWKNAETQSLKELITQNDNPGTI